MVRTEPRTRDALRPRLSTVTSWPASTACSTQAVLMFPVPPRNSSFIRLPREAAYGRTADAEAPFVGLALRALAAILHAAARRISSAAVDVLVGTAGITRGRGTPVAGRTAAPRIGQDAGRGSGGHGAARSVRRRRGRTARRRPVRRLCRLGPAAQAQQGHETDR